MDQDQEIDLQGRDYIGEATYSAEDNKLRLYAYGRLDQATYERVKAAGFRWAPKQELFVAPGWTPAREDLLIDLCGEIGDEDYSPEERSADRAERFSEYRDKRRAEAGGFAGRFEDGPQAFGHQNRQRAERQAARHDRLRGRACTQWSKAEYWQQRTEGVIAHALFKSSAMVRRGRLVKLETDLRKHQAGMDRHKERRDSWRLILEMEGADEVLPLRENSCSIAGQFNAAQLAAYRLADDGHCWFHVWHPTCQEANEEAMRIWKHGFSLYDLLTRGEFLGKQFDRLSPKQVAEIYLNATEEPGDPDSLGERWKRHYELRIGYEKAMLAAEGGMAGDLEMEPGGFVKGMQIHKVNKSPATGRVTSVEVWGRSRIWRNEDGSPSEGLIRIKVERLGEDAYRPPTGEEREAFLKAQAERKAEEKASRPKTPSLINPTDEDAQKLQEIWNAEGKARWMARGGHSEFSPGSVVRMTQKAYSAVSKGSYAHFGTADVTEKLLTAERGQRRGRHVVFKVRKKNGSGFSWDAVESVVVIADKPQKSIPWDDAAKIAKDMPTEESVFPALGRVAAALGKSCGVTGEERELIRDAGYVGWAYSDSHTQHGFTDAGKAAYQRYLEAERSRTMPMRRDGDALVIDAISVDMAREAGMLS